MAATAPDATTHPFGQADEDALRIVMLRQGKKLVTSFHPELSPDIRIHEYFIRKICLDA
jgi:5'-phosphate synthase pdxT subunit